MTIEEKCRLSCYEKVTALNEKHGVWLVKHKESGEISVMKELAIYNEHVYEMLKMWKCRCFPQIIDYFATDEKKLIVIEEYISGRTLDNIIRKDGIFHEEKAQDTILIGTEGFAAPEQYGFRQSDPRTDIYAVGVLLNYMLTGKNQVEKLAEGRFQNMILKCTKLAPEARYQSVDDILHGINHLFSYGGNSNYQSVKEKVTYTSSIKSENLRSGFMNMVENVMRFIRWTNQMENSSNKSLNQESKPSWRRFLPPGFRSGQPWKMALAVIGYISIIYFSVGMTMTNSDGSTVISNCCSVIMKEMKRNKMMLAAHQF
ncbi:MAG: hypothetical protein PHW47_04960 [Lachnospira sp.]|nr:hypothetical protein [Lachnospira sp.]